MLAERRRVGAAGADGAASLNDLQRDLGVAGFFAARILAAGRRCEALGRAHDCCPVADDEESARAALVGRARCAVEDGPIASIELLLLSTLGPHANYLCDIVPGMLTAGFGLGVASVSVAVAILTGAALRRRACSVA